MGDPNPIRLFDEELGRLSQALGEAEAVLVGVGAGTSISAGLSYTGERLHTFFPDFCEQNLVRDMYEGSQGDFESPERKWAYLSRFVYLNRYEKAPVPVYETLYELLDGREGPAGKPKKDYFILTTNQDHQLQKAGFEKKRIFYTQGDFGLFQCSRPCLSRTYENKSQVVKMVLSQGFAIGEEGELLPPDGAPRGEVSPMLVPYCPVCGSPMTLSLAAEEGFVQEEGWHQAAGLYGRFLEEAEKKKVLLLELGVGYQTPGIIKYQFWNLAREWGKASYACVNLQNAGAPEDLSEKAICLQEDIGRVLGMLTEREKEQD